MRVLLVACLLIAGAAPSLAADAQLPADWGVVSAGAAFTLHAPPGTHFEPRSGIDSFVGEFVHPDFKIQFDYGMYSNDLADMRSDGRYQQQQATVDGRAAVIVWGRGAANMSWGCAGHLVAMYVAKVDPGGVIRLEIHGCARDADTVSNVIRIFKTIRFLRGNRP